MALNPAGIPWLSFHRYARRRQRMRRHEATLRPGYVCCAALLGLLLTGCESEIPVEINLRPALAEIPADLAAVKFTSEGSPTAPYVMLELNRPGGFSGFVALNRDARPVWYFRTRGGPNGFTRRRNGNFVLLDSQRGLIEVTPDTSVVHELPQQAAPDRRIHHDVIADPSDRILFVADDWQVWHDTLINGASIWEWSPESGIVTKRWSSFGPLNPDLDRGQRTVPADWVHQNSLSIGPRGNILLSMYFLNQVISISSDWQSIEWRLGGIRATIPVTDFFSGQHTAQEIQPGRVLMFDNGADRAGEKFSRAVEIEISGQIARTVWEWRPAKDNWAPAIGSARRLVNGNTVIAFGLSAGLVPGATGPIEVYEVESSGSIVWHLTVGGETRSTYRATPVFEF